MKFIAFKYPNIAHACFAICIDSGGINRLELIDKWERECHSFLGRQEETRTPETLTLIDVWLGALSDADFETVCAGEETEAAQVLQFAPLGTSDILDDYFTDDDDDALKDEVTP